MSNSLYTCNCDVIHEDIVNDVKGKMQPKDDYIQLASLFKLFGDGTRVQILHALEQSEMCVCDLAVLLGVTKSAISHQLKALRLAGLVKFRREAQIVYYSLADDHVKEIIDKGFEHAPTIACFVARRINHRIACSGAFHNVVHLLTSIFPLIRARIRPQGLKEEPLYPR